MNMLKVRKKWVGESVLQCMKMYENGWQCGNVQGRDPNHIVAPIGRPGPLHEQREHLLTVWNPLSRRWQRKYYPRCVQCIIQQQICSLSLWRLSAINTANTRIVDNPCDNLILDKLLIWIQLDSNLIWTKMTVSRLFLLPLVRVAPMKSQHMIMRFGFDLRFSFDAS